MNNSRYIIFSFLFGIIISLISIENRANSTSLKNPILSPYSWQNSFIQAVPRFMEKILETICSKNDSPGVRCGKVSIALAATSYIVLVAYKSGCILTAEAGNGERYPFPGFVIGAAIFPVVLGVFWLISFILAFWGIFVMCAGI